MIRRCLAVSQPRRRVRAPISASFGASLSGALSDTTQISISYDYKFGGHDFTDHQIMGRLSHQF